MGFSPCFADAVRIGQTFPDKKMFLVKKIKKKQQLEVQILQLGHSKWIILFLLSCSGFKKKKKILEM